MPLFGISAASIGSALKSGVESAKETASNLADSGAELLNFESADGNGVPPKAVNVRDAIQGDYTDPNVVARTIAAGSPISNAVPTTGNIYYTQNTQSVKYAKREKDGKTKRPTGISMTISVACCVKRKEKEFDRDPSI